MMYLKEREREGGRERGGGEREREGGREGGRERERMACNGIGASNGNESSS